jgi:hypothetical protein
MESLALVLAVNTTQTYARSALPDAPVVPFATPRPSRIEPVRRGTAAALHRLAYMVEPRAASVGRPATG